MCSSDLAEPLPLSHLSYTPSTEDHPSAIKGHPEPLLRLTPRSLSLPCSTPHASPARRAGTPLLRPGRRTRAAGNTTDEVEPERAASPFPFSPSVSLSYLHEQQLTAPLFPCPGRRPKARRHGDTPEPPCCSPPSTRTSPARTSPPAASPEPPQPVPDVAFTSRTL